MPEAEACDFCAMLSPRGAVYTVSSGAFQAHDHCGWYTSGKTRTQTLDMANGVVRSLEAAQVIARAASVSRGLTYFDYNIQPWAWDFLRQYPELLD
ncbi:MAG: super-infection exclusion protein B [Chloroflexi bacterium]|nr:super-infection exclusion protein B [Chloroflexota bacterium]